MDRFEKEKGLGDGFKIGLMGALIGGLVVGMIILGVLYATGTIGGKRTETIAGQKVVVNDLEASTQVEAVAQVVPQSVVGVTAAVIQQSLMGTTEGQSVGSGFIVTTDGYIVTNQHVVADSTSITISLDDGGTYPGKLIWSDSNLDLAVVKIEKTDLPVVTLGDSNAVKVGETVIAIGNPMGLNYERSVTAGIVSALNRSLMVDSNLVAEDLIQTDATINAGNSGGPLCNGKGDVIGINTYKNYQAEGMGFALPVNILRPIISKIVANGSFTPIVIGISGYDSQQAAYFSNTEQFDSGIYVNAVESGSGAEQAGLAKWDIIISLEGQNVNSMLGMKSILYALNPGDTISITYKHGNAVKAVDVTVQAAQ